MLRRWVPAAACAVSLILTAGPGVAGTVTFDDLTGTASRATLSSPYQGFTWVNFAYLDGEAGGFASAVVSRQNVAINDDQADADVIMSGGFTFIAASFTAACSGTNLLRLYGLRDGTARYYEELTLDSAIPVRFEANWDAIDHLIFTVDGLENQRFLMDDFSFSTPVPDPGSSLLLLGAALGGLIVARRRLR